jgi:hypothetical protein
MTKADRFVICSALLLSLGAAQAEPVKCNFNASDVVAQNPDAKEPILIPVKGAFCIDTKGFPEFQLGDGQNWEVSVLNRDENKRATGWRVSPRKSGYENHAYLQQADGKVIHLVLKSVN